MYQSWFHQYRKFNSKPEVQSKRSSENFVSVGYVTVVIVIFVVSLFCIWPVLYLCWGGCLHLCLGLFVTYNLTSKSVKLVASILFSSRWIFPCFLTCWPTALIVLVFISTSCDITTLDVISLGETFLSSKFVAAQISAPETLTTESQRNIPLLPNW